MRLKISAVVLAKNEEQNLPDCLESLSWVDEIVVVDDASSDRTAEIAQAAGCKVVVHPMESFAGQRALALKECSFDWVLWVDADMRVPVSAHEEIIRRLETDRGKFTAYRMLIQEFLLWRKVRWTEWGPKYHWFTGPHLMIIRKSKWRFLMDQTVHEVMTGEGRIGRLTKPLHHTNAHPSLHTRIEKTIRYARLEAEMEFRRGKRVKWYNFALDPFLAFVKSFVWFRGLLDGVNGWIVAWCAIMTEVCKCFYGYEMQQDPGELEARRREVQESWKKA